MMMKNCDECMYDAPHEFCCQLECMEHEWCRFCTAECKKVVTKCPAEESEENMDKILEMDTKNLGIPITYETYVATVNFKDMTLDPPQFISNVTLYRLFDTPTATDNVKYTKRGFCVIIGPVTKNYATFYVIPYNVNDPLYQSLKKGESKLTIQAAVGMSSDSTARKFLKYVVVDIVPIKHAEEPESEYTPKLVDINDPDASWVDDVPDKLLIKAYKKLQHRVRDIDVKAFEYKNMLAEVK